MARQQKTEQQRAEEALAVARRKVDRLTKERDQLEAQLKTVKTDLRDAQSLRDYRAQHPALPKSPPSPSASSIPTTPKESTTP